MTKSTVAFIIAGGALCWANLVRVNAEEMHWAEVLGAWFGHYIIAAILIVSGGAVATSFTGRSADDKNYERTMEERSIAGAVVVTIMSFVYVGLEGAG